VTHRPRASPLHAARAVAGLVWCLAVSGAALAFDHPVVLVSLLGVVLAAASAARVGPEVRRIMLIGLPFALLYGALNPLVSRSGVTVLLRGGEVPVIGQLDITLEATAYGGILFLRGLILMGAFALHSAAVDPDDLLRAFRRTSFRGALTAALATRMVPVLARDARRMADAQRMRPGPPPSRVALVRAVATGALDRAADVAATLEVRGYGSIRKPPASRRPWSRHDIAFVASAAALVAVSIAGADPFQAYPRLHAPLDTGVWLTAGVLVACALAPFADRRGIAR
jgi:energy-coupling factor transport system permease protein